eukprot:12442022-Prorocentrum_lima.AAC.1
MPVMLVHSAAAAPPPQLLLYNVAALWMPMRFHPLGLSTNSIGRVAAAIACGLLLRGSRCR